MKPGDLTLNLGRAVHEARAYVNEMTILHGPDSILTQRARVQLRVASTAARTFMEADD